MDWKELKEKSKLLQAEGKSEQEAAELLRDEIRSFARECIEHPEKIADVMPDLGKMVQENPVLATLLLSSKGGWGM